MQKAHVVISLAAVATVVGFIVGESAWSRSANAELPAPQIAQAPVAQPSATMPAPAVDDVVTDPTVERRARLADYVGEDVMMHWSPAVPQMPTVNPLAVAGDIATVAMEQSKLPADQAHDAVLLAGLAYWEGARYAAYVDDGRCQDDVWRASPEGARLMRIGGDCDHKHAHSLWQIHPIVDQSATLYALCNQEVVDRSRIDAARCALAIARASLRATGNLSQYTGEWAFEHPKADLRLDFVNKALEKHPFRP